MRNFKMNTKPAFITHLVILLIFITTLLLPTSVFSKFSWRQVSDSRIAVYDNNGDHAGEVSHQNYMNGRFKNNDGDVFATYEVKDGRLYVYNLNGEYEMIAPDVLTAFEIMFNKMSRSSERGSSPSAPPPEFANEKNFGLVSVRLRNEDSRAYNDWKIWIDGKLAGFVYEFLPPKFLNVPYGGHTIEVGYGFEEQGLKQIHKTYRVNINSQTGNGVIMIPD